MNLSAMKKILADEDIQLTRSLGQSFLHDGNQLRRIIEAAELKDTDKVLEVGPGLGPLTELLVGRAACVLAIEKDARLVEVLRRRFQTGAANAPAAGAAPLGPDLTKTVEAGAGGLTLVHDDALDFLREGQRDWSGWKLVANLPYSVASPILIELALAASGPDRLVATLQWEVAKRLMAEPGGSDYGVLTLLMGLNYEARGCFKIPAGCFFPRPEVDSACVCLTRRDRPLLPMEHKPTFIRLVKRGFSQRRKIMRKLLKAEWPEEKLAAAFEDLEGRGLPGDARAETAALQHFVRLTELLEGDSGNA